MARNTALLERTMRHVTDHPEVHDQRVWMNECGTAGCFAGWACLLSGWQVMPYTIDGWVTDGDSEELVATVAARLLGLSEWEADMLFDPRNSRDVLALMVKDLVNGDSL